jgi:hypothetical protein
MPPPPLSSIFSVPAQTPPRLKSRRSPGFSVKLLALSSERQAAASLVPLLLSFPLTSST